MILQDLHNLLLEVEISAICNLQEIELECAYQCGSKNCRLELTMHKMLSIHSPALELASTCFGNWVVIGTRLGLTSEGVGAGIGVATGDGAGPGF